MRTIELPPLKHKNVTSPLLQHRLLQVQQPQLLLPQPLETIVKILLLALGQQLHDPRQWIIFNIQKPMLLFTATFPLHIVVFHLSLNHLKRCTVIWIRTPPPAVLAQIYLFITNPRSRPLGPINLFLNSLMTAKQTPIVSASSVAYDCPFTLKTYIVHIHQGLYFPELEHNLINPNQCPLTNNVIIDESPNFCLSTPRTKPTPFIFLKKKVVSQLCPHTEFICIFPLTSQPNGTWTILMI